MKHRKVGWRLAAVALTAAIAASLAACSGGVSQADYDTVKKQLQDEQQKAQTYQQQLSTKVQESASLQQQVAAKDKTAADLQKQLADTQAAAGKLSGITPLIYAKSMPTPTPRPTPTPLPAGFTPPPAPPPATVPPEVANEVLPFTFYVETLATSSLSKYAMASFPACVPNSVFKRGTKLVWRFEIFDTKTGKRVTTLDNPVVKINIPGADSLTSRYSKRGGTGPWMWSGGWDIPLDYPLGPVNYTITVTLPDGRTGTFKEPALVKPESGIDSRVRVIEEMVAAP